ncbi:MAG TPA: DivIVA domain-containing protein [Gemmatimonadetes bacterium]|mgnify:CR=1 FL=1|jgi:DivIVA domain-containing protein|nr:DivIVA domain-containing protein [Gemmatimonadota bacterium]|tara:strand:- start:2903 stop:3610 length:708 start_codon:yes stop_codon:yes gene_type:complete
MIDLTPLDVRNKRGDFKKLMRGYDPQEVDVFLEIAAERLEELVRENIVLRERSESLERQVGAQTGREQAIQEALVTAQELRADIHSQAQREADHLVKESETEARRLAAEAEANVRNLIRDAERRLELGRDALEEMERRRTRFLKAFRQLLERELDVVDVEDERAPLEDRPIDLDLGGGRFSSSAVEEVSAAMEAEESADGEIEEAAAEPGAEEASEEAADDAQALLLSLEADEDG